jgi:hypothetical protein
VVAFLGNVAWGQVLQPSARYDQPRSWVRHLATELPPDLGLGDLAVVESSGVGDGVLRGRQLRILLAIYRNDPRVPTPIATPDELRRWLSSDRRRALVDPGAFAALPADLRDELAIEHEHDVLVGKATRKLLLLKRRRTT